MIGATPDGDCWILTPAAVLVAQHTLTGREARAADSLHALIAGSLEAAIAYFDLFGRREIPENWQDAVQSSVTSPVDPAWLRRSIASRPRPR